MKVFFTLILIAIQYQSAQQVTNVLDTSSDLSNNIVHNTFQDKEGFIWIATLSGLNRYDGYDIIPYFNQPNDSSSLSSNTIRSIIEDKNGDIWIGSYNGLNKYDPRKNSFDRFLELPELPTSRLDMQEMVYDEEAHCIWFNTLQTTGWFDIETETFYFLPKEFETFSITKHERGILALTKKNEIYIVEQGSQNFIKVGDIDRVNLNPIHKGRITSELWIASSMLKNDQQKVPWKGLPDVLNSKQLTSLLEVSESKMWVGSDEGLFEYDHVNNVIIEIDLSEEPSFLTSSIQSLFQDREGGIWVGTLGGLFYFDSAESQFQHLDFSPETGDVIMGMAENNDTVLINIFSNKMAGLQVKNLTIVPSLLNDYLTGEELQVWDIEIVPDSEFRIWVATNNGLILYNPETGQVKKRYFQQLYSQAIFSIESTENGPIYISTLSNIHEMNRADGEQIRTIQTVDFVKQSNIQDMALINNWMFFATEGEGLAKVNLDSGEIIEINSGADLESNPLKNNAIWDILYGSNNELWVGSSRGLFRYNLENEELSRIEYDSFIANRIVYSILEYGSTLWIGTEQGLIHVSKVDAYYRVYSHTEGVQNFEFNRRSAIEIKNGYFLFGGVEGLTIFEPSNISESSYQPPLRILDMKIFEKDSSFSPILDLNNTVELKWNQNTIEFAFAALNYSNPDGMYYRYQLEGMDENWVMDRSSRNPRYAQLPPGEYKFMVQSSLAPSFNEAINASIAFDISPPFWQTFLFRFSIISLLVIVIWIIYRYRVESLLEVERVRLRIARDLHDEVGSGLSGIALAGDILTHKLEHQSNGDIEDIKKITSNARAMASSLDGIVWLINSNKETLGDLITKCRSVSKELLINHRVTFSSHLIDHQKEITLSSESKRHLFLFFKEAINNILKHASAKSANISFSLKGNKLQCLISDDGIGFDTQTITKGNGLDSMIHRATELGADLQIKSNISVGTTLELTLKLPESRYS